MNVVRQESDMSDYASGVPGWSESNPDTTPGAVCAELPSCNATGHSVRCPRGVAVVTIEQIVDATPEELRHMEQLDQS